MRRFILLAAIIVASGCGPSPVEQREKGIVTAPGKGASVYAETVEIDGRVYDVFHTGANYGGVHAVIVDPKEVTDDDQP